MERLQTDAALNYLDPSTKGWAFKRHELGILSDSELQRTADLKIWQEREPVAIHEEGHVAVARYFRWSLILKSVIPDGNTLGVTKTTPNPSTPESDVVLQAISVSAAGEVAEESFGLSHDGCGFDRGRQRWLGALYKRLTGTLQSVESIVDHQRSKARSIIGGIGETFLRNNAMKLAKAGSLSG